MFYYPLNQPGRSKTELKAAHQKKPGECHGWGISDLEDWFDRQLMILESRFSGFATQRSQRGFFQR